MRRTRTPPALAGLAATIALAVPAPASALRLKPCGISGFGCATLTVPLDRSSATPGTIGLRVAAQTGRPSKHLGLLVALAGGPGQGGVDVAPAFVFSLQPALRRYRLAVIDQRGTGRSQPLDCPDLQSGGEFAEVTPDDVARCADLIGPRRAFYSTIDSVEDIDALRAAFHVRRIALAGVSYGTFVAQQYARVHPDRVSRLILDSVVAPQGVDAFQLDSFRRLDRVLREQCSRGACAGVTKDPVADLAALVDRLNAGQPIRGRAFDGAGRAREQSITSPDDLFNLVVAGDLNPYLQPSLPAAMRTAAAGDPAMLLRLLRLADGPPLKVRELSFAVNVITFCEDSRLPYTLTTPVEQRLDRTEQATASLVPGDLGPFDPPTARRLSLAQACLFFPPDPVRAPSTAPLPDVPALVLDGRLDVRTPLENGRQVAAELPHAQVITVHGTGHGVLAGDLSGCTQLALARFMAGRRVGKPCGGVTNAVPPTPLPPRSLNDYRLAPRVSGRRGRAVSAVLDTVQDAQLSLLEAVFSGFSHVRGGGLRGGSFSADERGRLVLHRYSLLRGLRVSGRVDITGEAPRGVVRVRGAGVDGVLRLGATGSVRGRLGGRRVRSPPAFVIELGARAASVRSLMLRRLWP